MNTKVRIAGTKTVGDWQQLRRALVPGCDQSLWRTAFRTFFESRISSRYLKPIALLQEARTFGGEGFSILAIHCSLVEFL